MRVILIILFGLCILQGTAQTPFPTTPDGMQWLRDHHYFWDRYFVPGNKENPYAGSTSILYSKAYGSRYFSPNLKYSVGLQRITSDTWQEPRNPKAKFYRVYHQPFAPKLYPTPLQFLDQFYPLAVLDDGTMLTTNPTFTKKTSSLKNLYLENPISKTSFVVYTGIIMPEAFPSFEYNVLSAVSHDNKRIAVAAAKQLFVIDVDTKQTSVAQLSFGVPFQAFGKPNTLFFAEDNLLVGMCDRITKDGVTGLELRTFDAATAQPKDVVFYPEPQYPEGSISFLPLKGNAYLFDGRTLELSLYKNQKDGDKKTIVKLDTTGLGLQPMNKYYKLLMETQEGLHLSIFPREAMRFHSNAMVAFEAKSGKWRRQFYLYGNAMESDAEIAKRNAANAAYTASLCTKGEEQARAYAGLSYDHPKGRMYILDFDCKTGLYVVGYFRHSEFYGPPGSAKKMPHNYIYIERGAPPASGPTNNGRQVCTACNGTPIGTSTSQSMGWTKRYVLGGVYYIKDDAVNTTTRYSMCGVCKGEGSVRN